MALVPWIWNLGLTGAEIWIYHRLDLNDPALTAAAAAIAAFEPYPCNSSVRLQQLLPNKGREAAVYLSHIVRHYDNLPQGLVLIHDHGPASRHSLCGPFFRRVRGYYSGIREQLLAAAARRRRQSLANDGDHDDDVDVVAKAGIVPQLTTIAGGGGGGGDGAARHRSLAASSRQRRRHGDGGGSAAARGNGSAAAVRQALKAFADQVVSLSSGCQENWLKGCCAALVCAEDPMDEEWGSAATSTTAAAEAAAATFPEQRQLLERTASASADAAAADTSLGDAFGRPVGSTTRRPYHNRCPFKTSRCLTNASAVSVPLRGGAAKGTIRWLYMHGAGGLYDVRYENQVVLYDKSAIFSSLGLNNAGFGPLSLVRYAGPDASETLRMQTSSTRVLDYPAGQAQRTPQETFAQLGKILSAHDFAHRKVLVTLGNFKSCCASMMLRPKHIRRWPKTLYEQMLSYTLDDKNTYHASLAVSHHGWAMWSPADVGPQELLRYFEVDLLQLNVRGCPGWRVLEEEVE
ncbi:hypothetical protein VOLCADRAFT_95734 [Volvox carteri f. nagariensis]|uniref:Uncharacterized protein n=1 Tax=Volvox carteri f. nagariensis TaxID=3068 RepID=D8U887_VOLCA|nr:uncharacterized protein VOLCADRAFT_95734 [Volvox carteri f. nagariensis]EFJ44097.1 hypothetical protein VOLCADRAFT_95734 [Volvox carteri f. nagariensis]|eukprot:XP_002954898.1 hypothetical protein VOLCADRAFT_95734 [Volvox carteri f. nagariensis]